MALPLGQAGKCQFPAAVFAEKAILTGMSRLIRTEARSLRRGRCEWVSLFTKFACKCVLEMPGGRQWLKGKQKVEFTYTILMQAIKQVLQR